MDINVLKAFAEFLQNYGSYAFETLLVFALVYVHRQWQKSEREKFELALSIAPLAEAMTSLVQNAARAKAKRSSPPPPSSNLGA